MIQFTKTQGSQTRSLVLMAGVITTFMVWTPLAIDPTNFPKMFVLSIFAAWIFGAVAVAMFFGKYKKISLGQWAVIAFAAGILLTALMSDVRYTAFLGTWQRNDGALSYLAFAVLGIAAMMSFEVAHSLQLRTGLLVVGTVLTAYGLLQTTGNDPLKWVLTYGPMIGTLGNPDFMSATVGLSAIATVWLILGENKLWIRLAAAGLLLLEVFVVRRSGSIQGLLAFGFGFAVLALTRLWQRKARLGLVSTLVVGVLGILAVLGMANKGPLASFLYRASLKNRLDYWHAAIGMFKAHPLFGVGLDRFGEYYGVYAPQVQVSQGQATNNAHNVFLQLLATGGLLVMIPYLFLIGVIFFASLKAIRATRGSIQLNLVAVFAIWSALLLISIISIDNLGVAVWFWISGGILYAIARRSTMVEEEKTKRKKKSKKADVSNSTYVAPIVSLVVTILVLVPMVSIWSQSAAVSDLQVNRNRLSPQLFLEKMNEVANISPKNAQTLYFLSDIAMRIHNPELALKYVAMVNEKDPRSNYGHQLAAIAYETQEKYQQAIPFRLELLKLSPWNTANMVILVKDYLQIKDATNATLISGKIAQLYPNSADAKAAAALLKG